MSYQLVKHIEGKCPITFVKFSEIDYLSITSCGHVFAGDSLISNTKCPVCDAIIDNVYPYIIDGFPYITTSTDKVRLHLLCAHLTNYEEKCQTCKCGSKSDTSVDLDIQITVQDPYISQLLLEQLTSSYSLTEPLTKQVLNPTHKKELNDSITPQMICNSHTNLLFTKDKTLNRYSICVTNGDYQDTYKSEMLELISEIEKSPTAKFKITANGAKIEYEGENGNDIIFKITDPGRYPYSVEMRKIKVFDDDLQRKIGTMLCYLPLDFTESWYIFDDDGSINKCDNELNLFIMECFNHNKNKNGGETKFKFESMQTIEIIDKNGVLLHIHSDDSKESKIYILHKILTSELQYETVNNGNFADTNTKRYNNSNNNDNDNDSDYSDDDDDVFI